MLEADVVVTVGASQEGGSTPEHAAATPAQNTSTVKLELAQIAIKHSTHLDNRESICGLPSID